MSFETSNLPVECLNRISNAIIASNLYRVFTLMVWIYQILNSLMSFGNYLWKSTGGIWQNSVWCWWSVWNARSPLSSSFVAIWRKCIVYELKQIDCVYLVHTFGLGVYILFSVCLHYFHIWIVFCTFIGSIYACHVNVNKLPHSITHWYLHLTWPSGWHRIW